ncbi:MAG: hypothetical protein CVU62_14580 [Deltaproteobacteria bacterium HGW-Deltaproteobacteria-2]|jgi:hypothetical protein|nr:MAG: hypothetical protein CVU62_14580 [Deltaproteobacteria bacterium HGW-Deltaproteobacteria-2]
MSNYKVVTLNYRCWILIYIALALFAQVSISYGAGRLLVWPKKEGITQTTSSASLKSYEVRKGQIVLTRDILPKRVSAEEHQTGHPPSKGDSVSLNLFPDVTHEVKVNSVKRYKDGTMIISGKLKDHKNSTVVMTMGNEGFLMTIQDMNRAMLYRVRGNSADGSGSVTEIDMKKMPPVIR